ncbi:hypothetical protein [Candidatus Methylopumilus rimovensis]|uniref:hypothetical protein n=1 Tax=Candidatus Methylopumilus rimovensis TaxID=2588535 RepID=UPI00112459C4|nr:hypothetical protein [Candidatus Methylopumilus rimovensis]QDD11711.1 hypothetical protein FIT62_00775 [Candidatus Methylopumilus rimovensis]
MQTLKLNQSKLLGFKISPRIVKSRLTGIGAKAGKIGKPQSPTIGAKIGKDRIAIGAKIGKVN